jgi:hypothetical protein
MIIDKLADQNLGEFLETGEPAYKFLMILPTRIPNHDKN